VGDQAGMAPACEETSARVDKIRLVIHDEKAGDPALPSPRSDRVKGGCQGVRGDE
jgi:hypothetical protein